MDIYDLMKQVNDAFNQRYCFSSKRKNSKRYGFTILDNSSLSNRTQYIAKRYSAERLAYFYGKEGWTLWLQIWQEERRPLLSTCPRIDFRSPACCHTFAEARKNSGCSPSCHIDNGNSIRVCRTTGQSFRAPALVICAPKTKPQNR